MEKEGSFSVYSKNSKQTEKLGKIVAIFSNSFPKIGLIGDLGGGKTTFTKGLAKGLGIKGSILSPTFLIVKEYFIKKNGFKKFYHADLYRLDEGVVLLETGLEEVLGDSQSIVLVEWADKVKLTNFSLVIEFHHTNQNNRIVRFLGNSNLEKLKKEIVKNGFSIKE